MADEVGTKTEQDAFERVLRVREGSLAGRPTPQYLYALRRHLYKFIDEVELAINQHHKQEREKADAANS